jgi:YHS domain-containing protein
MNISFTSRRASFAALITLATVAMSMSASAYDAASTSELNVDAKGVALRGHDPVSYFTSGVPAQGRADLTADHNGAVYRFASAANRDAFSKDPAKYAPQYGGFCAMGVALAKKLDGDPAVWRVVDGKLYLSVDKDVQAAWLKDTQANIGKAETSWPGIRHRAPQDL